MSRFIDTMRDASSGELRMRTGWPESIKVSVKTAPQDDFRSFHKERRFEAKWIVLVSCRDEDLDAALRNAREELMEAVYGDFRTRLIRLERAILERDSDKAMDCMRQLWAEVK